MAHHHEHHEHKHHSHEHEHVNEHEHHHEHGLLSPLTTIVASALLLAACVAVEHFAELPKWQLLLLYLVPYLLAGHETLLEAAEGIAHGDFFNEHFLMSLATIGALAIGFLPRAETEFPEAVFVMLFFQIGELLEGYAEGRSRDSIAHLMEIRPDVALLERADGTTEEVSPESVAVGQTVVVKAGGRVPIDGVVVSGSTSLDTQALTGESMPRTVGPGDEVVSGCISLSGVVRLRTTKTFSQSTASKIIELVESAGDHKSESERFISRFARVYTPIVVLLAVAVALVPPLLVGHFPLWLHRALLFLVVSCPCALVISVPLTFFGGIGGASRHGILIKGANFIDSLARLSTVVFDKTGTLTHGRFSVLAVCPEQCSEERLLHLAAHVERHSTHPIAAALRQAFPREATDGCTVADVEELAGQGIRARVGSETVFVGNEKLMHSIGVEWHPCHHPGTIVHVAIDGTYAGHIVICDTPKPDSAEAIEQLRSQGVSRLVMLTGDSPEAARPVAAQLCLTEFHASLLPADKVARLEQLLLSQPKGRTLAFLGDGINDAPVLARADVGVAMGGLGSDAAIDAADVVVMDDKPSRLPQAVAIARRTIAIARQNVVFAIGVKAAVLLLAAAGLATMPMAVFADVGVTLLAVVNAMRAMKC